MPSNPSKTTFPQVAIEDIAASHAGSIKIGPFGSQLKKEDLSKSGYKVYGQENIITGDFSLGERRIDKAKFSALKSCQLFPGDLVLTMMGTIGKCAIFPQVAEVGIMDSHLLRIQVNREIADPRYVALVVAAEEVVGQQIKRMSHGSIMSGLSSGIVRRLQLPLPSLLEQRRIAEILDTLDATIAQTEALIAKLKQTRAGLLHDLLTRGLDEHGELRDPVANPEQFKETVIGRVPREWEITRLGAVVARSGGFLQTGPFGSQLHAHEYVKEGVPVIMPQDILGGHVSEEQIARVSAAKALSLARHQVENNDVVFARRGDLERCAAISQREVGWLCGTGCLLFRPPAQEIDGRWMAAAYQHDLCQRQILARAVGSTMVNLNTSLLANLVIAKPKVAEQAAIVGVIDAHDSHIRSDEAYCDKLKLQKQGLMHDLLTGQVRVREL